MKKTKKILLIAIIIVIAIAIWLNIHISNNDDTMNQEYSIKDKKFYLYEDENDRDEEYRGIKLLEYDNSSEEYAEIYYISYDYTTDPSYYYTIKITDEKNKSIFLDGAEEKNVIGGVVSSVKIKKIDLTSKINIAVFEKFEETNNVEDSAQVQIDLSNDLEEKIKIDQSVNLTSANLDGVKFKYIDSEYVYFGTTAHAYSEKLVGENCSFPLNSQYGNNLISEEHIGFYYDKNVNNLSLEEAFDSVVLINGNMGQYGLSDVYGLAIYDYEKEEFIETIIVSFEEMIKLCKGETIKKEGKEYSKNTFSDEFATLSMYKDEYVEIGNDIKAIKYHFEYGDNTENYMFIHKDNIYNITVPTNKRTSEAVQNFLDSLEI